MKEYGTHILKHLKESSPTMDYFKGIQRIKNIYIFRMVYVKNQHNKKQERKKKYFPTVSGQ